MLRIDPGVVENVAKELYIRALKILPPDIKRGFDALAARETAATAQNVLFNIGRAVGGFGPVVIAAVSVGYGFETAIALLAVLYVVDMVAMWALIPERKGTELV